MNELKPAINVNDITVIEYHGQRVLTTKQIALGYGCDFHNIVKNFNYNKDRFEKGVHYFKIVGDELRAFKEANSDLVGNRAVSMLLWTRRGAARHCKLIGTDQAWDMFDELEEYYFDVHKKQTPEEQMAYGIIAAKQIIEQRDKEIEVLRPKAAFADAVSGSKDSILIGTLAKFICQNGFRIGQNQLFRWMRLSGYLGSKGKHYNIPTQRSIRAGLLEIKESNYKNGNGEKQVCQTPLVTGKGQVYFINKFIKENSKQHGKKITA